MIENLKALAVFARTVESGTFRAAARALGLSPSVVSHHISELERRLEVPLLYRSTRHLALTPDGERLFHEAREMVAAAERGLDALGERGEGLAGRLRVTAPALLAETRFCRDIGAFTRAHPRVTLALAFTERRQDLLRDGFDVALRIGRLEDSTLKVRRLALMPRVLVASPSYVALHARPRTVRDLDGWDFIQLSAVRPELALIPPGRKTPVVRPYRARAAVDSATALREMAIAGMGVTSLPEVLARRELAQGRLVEVLPSWRLPTLGVYAVWPAGAARPGLTLRFIDFMAEPLAALFA